MQVRTSLTLAFVFAAYLLVAHWDAQDLEFSNATTVASAR